MVIPAGNLVDLLHVPLHHGGNRVIRSIVGLLRLKIYIRALHGGALNGMLGVHGDAVKLLQRVLVHQGGNAVQINCLNLLNLVAGAEAVMEMNEGDPGLDGGQMGDGRKVHHLLHAG
ncbi:hypothetical protein SDC9_198869 [bioreactor metagenome]|uniref:Uncharacterized protein n=1 Tax=bioreactor metagenome TaxID=1076179 RepID=A0A645IIW1_9ZZZZ